MSSMAEWQLGHLVLHKQVCSVPLVCLLAMSYMPTVPMCQRNTYTCGMVIRLGWMILLWPACYPIPFYSQELRLYFWWVVVLNFGSWADRWFTVILPQLYSPPIPILTPSCVCLPQGLHDNTGAACRESVATYFMTRWACQKHPPTLPLHTHTPMTHTHWPAHQYTETYTPTHTNLYPPHTHTPSCSMHGGRVLHLTHSQTNHPHSTSLSWKEGGYYWELSCNAFLLQLWGNWMAVCETSRT